MRSPPLLALVAALALTQVAAAAAPPPSTAPKPAPPAATNAPAKPMTPEQIKRAACEKTWRAQTKHNGKHKAFVAACVAKG
jgi:hypothetical protein